MINLQITIQLISCLLLALCISLYVLRIVVNAVNKLGLFDKPNARSSASRPIPTLGGIAIFFSFVFVTTIGLYSFQLPEWPYILIALMLIFFVGLKDDIVNLSPLKKIVAQLIAAGILIFLANIRFTNLHGLLGITEIGLIPSILITCFTIVVIINAFNPMDGIDGLAAGLSLLISMVFGSWFLVSGHFDYALICFSLFGAVAGFFYLNVYGKEFKIFMGDTGSLLLGAIMSILVIRFNEFNISQTQSFAISSAPVISFGILAYPLIDTLRVMAIRIINHRSPFSADRNHLHHRLLALGFSHSSATYTIIASNAIFIMLVFIMHTYGVLRLTAYIVIAGSSLFMIPAFIIKKKKLIKKDDPFQQLLIPPYYEEREKNTRAVARLKRRQSELKPSTLASFFHRINFW